MKVILVSMKYDYGDKSRGSSGDYYYFEEPLKHIVGKVLSFDFMTVFQEKGKEGMNRTLLDMVRSQKPDVTVFVPYTDQFIPQVVDEINNHTTTLGYFYDDTWRIDYSGFWAKHFTYATTSDVNGIKRWRDLGYNNFIYSPFGCNHRFFVKKKLLKKYDVTFVGGYHPYRAWCVRRLRNAGIDAHAWGYGWANERLKFEGMVDVFNESRINLNLSNNQSWDFRYVMSPMKPVRDTLKAIKSALRAASGPDAKTREMVKARHFEINSCGGFQLSYYVEGLERHYQIGEEIAIYESIDGMIDKVHYYLKHEDEREAVARCGYERTLRDHRMEKRFGDLFDTIGMKNWRKD